MVRPVMDSIGWGPVLINDLNGIEASVTALDVYVEAKTVTVPTGTTGFASQPDGTLWVEYTP